MKVLIVVPRFVLNYGDFHHFPLGLAYIASSLKEAGHDVCALNLNHHFGPFWKLVSNYVKEHNVEVCATGGLSPFIKSVEAIFDAARLANPNIINICGGGLVSSDPEIALDLFDIDIGVVGEGEQSIVEAIAAYGDDDALANVGGIVFKDRSGKVVRTRNRQTVMDLSTIPWPDYELLGIEKYLEMQTPKDNYFFLHQPDSRPRSIEMISSRSCPFSCTFCFHPVGKVYRERSLDDFFAELDHLITRFNVNMVIVVDELFSLRKARLHEFCERIKAYGIQWMVQLHVSSVDNDTLKAMHDAGSPVISYGVESMSQPVLDSMQKKSKKDRIDQALALTYEHKIGIRANLIFGDTAETLETANESMGWWSQNHHYDISLVRLQVYPGSPDYIMAVRDELIDDRVEFSKILPIELNISNMNAANLKFMTDLMEVYDTTLLRPVFDPMVSVSELQIPGRSIAYDFIWSCPRCGHENESRGIIFKGIDPGFLTLPCHSCRAPSDVENPAAGREQIELKLGSSLREGKSMEMVRSPKRYRATIEAARKELEINKVVNKQKRSLKYSFERQSNWVDELRAAAKDLQARPFDADRHVRFARVLATIRIFGGATMHLRQAMKLEPDNQTYAAYLRTLMGSASYEKHAGTYYLSVSDDAPPFRASRQTGEYNRKKEPAFPVYSRAGNRASVAADAAD